MDTMDLKLRLRLCALLDQYGDAFAALARSAGPVPATVAADAPFAALRLQQRLRWPDGAMLVDGVGRCACDFLVAWREHGREATATRLALARHDAMLAHLRAALRAAAVPQGEAA